MGETQSPSQILDLWTALEVLSPQSFRRPEDLATGAYSSVVRLGSGPLPWERGGEKSRPNHKLYYQVALGTLDLDGAVDRLLARYADRRIERPAARGRALLGIAILNREGQLVEVALAISSFGWGLARALRDELSALAGWSAAESTIIEDLNETVRRQDADGRELPLDRVTLDAAYRWLVRRLELPSDLVEPPAFAIRCYEWFKNADPPEPLLLNSFFLRDLEKAKRLILTGSAPSNLARYFGTIGPSRRADLLTDRRALAEAVAPYRIPPARWPARHSLVLLQQAAVNLGLSELRESGVLAVNGPPGTGKTTLLRDLYAAIVTDRAAAMAKYTDPADAFSHSGEKLKLGSGWIHLYRLDPGLRGFEIVVASSNNRAVENVSAELPALDTIGGAGDLRYLKPLSDALAGRETWGLGAAVLGNASNRAKFRNTFWWDPEVGLSTYLAEVAGTPQLIVPGEGSGGIARPPRIVADEDPPRTRDEALSRWRKAKRAFEQAAERSEAGLTTLERARQAADEIPQLERVQEITQERLAESRTKEEDAASRLALAAGQCAEAQHLIERAEARSREIARARPGFLARWFRAATSRAWRVEHLQIERELNDARRFLNAASFELRDAEAERQSAAANRAAAESARREASARLEGARKMVAEARERLGIHFVDEPFFARERAALQLSIPWLDEAQQRLRGEVFTAAIALHRAFLDAAAKPLRHNLGALMNAFGGRKMPTSAKQALVPDLWASLFLVVPLVSTTFASVERMFGALPPEALGWLFIDEAGQALPQAAVGALMRTRRAIVVGDPVQIEPIVMLPEALTAAICRHFQVDADRFNAPNASVQTLADTATPCMATFETRFGSREVGVPLLVHRRCSAPMFDIANEVAYGNLMVQAKRPLGSRIGDVLGPSRWIDVCGGAEEKWCPEEGDVVLKLLDQLAKAGIEPDLYIVTPFVIVATNLRRLIRERTSLENWLGEPLGWTRERVGTVHTVQGREAEAVIFVLGAPEVHQTGARNWAGGSPNLLNVAVTRAKERLYVVGRRDLWRQAGQFRVLDRRLDPPARDRESG